MSVKKWDEAREIVSDTETKIPEKEERLCDQRECVILINRRDSLSSDCEEK